MEQKILYIGVDVDDQNFHIAAVSEEGELEAEVSCRPNAASLVKKLNKLREDRVLLKVCYEATYLGFSLYRDLVTQGFDCQVVAPTSIPRSAGPRVKTDRIDSKKLALYYQKSLLTFAVAPSFQDEAERDLLRSRGFLVEQSVRIRQHILSICRRAGLHYHQSSEKGGVSKNWTQRHYVWLEREIKLLPEVSLQNILNNLLSYLRQTDEQIAYFDGKIEELSNTEKYKIRAEALRCYRGINTITAMTLITELMDIKRFAHPKKITSYAGMDITEYSSGGKENKFGITKMGNRYIRTTLIEACQSALNPPVVSRTLRARRTETAPEFSAIADRCMHRLHKKGTKLLYQGKHRNKVKVACAREMIGFIWESLNKAQIRQMSG